MTDQASPAPRVIRQRIRNRVMEHLEVLSSFEEQLEYEAAAPVNVPYQLINGWEDWVHGDPADAPEPHDTYSAAEVVALGKVHRAWEKAADAIPDDYPTVATVQSIVEWGQLRDAAAEALTVFNLRGRLSDDREEY